MKLTAYLTCIRSLSPFSVAGSVDMYCENGIPNPWEVNTDFICVPTYTIAQEDIDAGLVLKTARYLDS